MIFSAGFVNAASIAALTPGNGETGVTNSPELTVLLSDVSPGTNVATFYGRQSPPSVRPDFTIIALPDTQFYTGLANGGTPDIFQAQTDWIVSNRVSRNIVFVTQLGDCVLRGNERESEWQSAADAMYRLENPVTTLLEWGIPYGVAPGNHDGVPPYGNSLYYNKYFGVAHFQGRPYYGGHEGTNNNNHFILFSEAGLDFIVVQLQYAPTAPMLNWANGILQHHRNRRAIVVTHSLLKAGTITFNAEGQPIYDALKANTNIFLMLCGHDPQSGVRYDTYAGNTITSYLSDFTNEPNGGNGWLRILEFSPTNNVIRFRTYSPTLNQFKTVGSQSFNLAYNMSINPPAYEIIDVVSRVGGGLASTAAWTNLKSYTRYEWYVTVDDGTAVFNSSVWTFTTSPDGSGGGPNAGFRIFHTSCNASAHFSMVWRSTGGTRYRVEYCDNILRWPGSENWSEIVRPEAEETDPAPPGSPGLRAFTDDFTRTGAPPPAGSRFYRVKTLP